MDFNFNTIRISAHTCSRRSSGVIHSHLPFKKPAFRFLPLASTMLMFGLLPWSSSHAAGDAARGRYNWEYTCQHCHGEPQPRKAAAFSDYDDTANKLSVYASDPAAITKAANEGYIVPDSNSNDKVEPGKSTNIPMGTWAGTAPNRLGLGTTPTQYAIDFSAYFASLFDVPGAPSIGAVSPGNAQASVSFTAPKSELTITSYTVTANPGGVTASGTASPITVTGLVNGTHYTFTVTATSNAGTGKPSSGNSITLAAPAAPIVAASANVSPVKAAPPVNLVSAAAAVPSNVTHSVQKTNAKTTPVSPAVPIVTRAAQTTGVMPGVSVAAANHAPAANTPLPNHPVSQGASISASSISAPIIKFAKAGNEQARLFFDAPAGANITGYTVIALSNGAPTGIKATGTKSPIIVNGLTNGTEYTFTLSANSTSGAIATSLPSNSVTPLRMLGD